MEFDNIYTLHNIFKGISKESNGLWQTSEEKKLQKELNQQYLKVMKLQKQIMQFELELKEAQIFVNAQHREIQIQNEIIYKDKVNEGIAKLLKVKDKKIKELTIPKEKFEREIANLREALELDVADSLEDLLNQGKSLEEVIQYRDTFDKILYDQE